MAVFEINLSGIERLQALAAGFDEKKREKIRLAIVRAINRALVHTKTAASAMIREKYYIKKSDIDPYVKVKGTKGNKLFGWVKFKGSDSLPLAKFSHSVGKKYISVRVMKENKGRKIMAGGSKEILATIRKKLPAAFKADGHIWARTANSEKPEILYGPSLMAFFKKEENVEILRAEAAEWFEKRLAHELSRIGL